MADKPAKSSDRLPLILTASIACILVLAVGMRLLSLENARWGDRLFRWRGVAEADPKVVILEMDDQSIKEVGSYPWPRRVYGDLLTELFSADISVLGIDVLFMDPSPSWEDDDRFSRMARRYRDRTVYAIDIVAHPKDPDQQSWRYPFPKLRAAGKHFGFVNQPVQDADAVVRWTPLFISPTPDPEKWSTDSGRIPSLGAAVLALHQNQQPESFLKDSKRNVANPNWIRLNYRGVENPGKPNARQGIKRLAAWKVIQKKMTGAEKAMLKGAIVLFGSTAVGAFDHFPNPFVESMPGVETHATVIDNLLHHRELSEPVGWSIVPLVAGFAAFSAWVVVLNPVMAALAIFGTLLAWIFFGYFAFSRYLFLMPFWEPTIGLIAPFSILMVRKTLLEQQGKRHIQQTFGRFVSPDVVKDLAENPDKVKIGAQERDMTVFFLDIAHFTTISEKIGNNIFEFLNVYLSALTEVIESEQKGTVDKYIGDCVMAFWNAPLDQIDHRVKACLAALRCQEVMEHTNKNHKFPFPLPEIPEARIGLNSGLMKVGFTGSQQKLQYTVIGDEVNLGSRLEGANKFFSSKIMVSDSCYKGAKDHIDARFLGDVRVVGKAVPIGVYELLAEKGKMSPAWQKALPIYNKGLEIFKEGVQLAQKKKTDAAAKTFEHSKDAFGQVLKIVPADGPSKLYLNTSEDYSQIPPSDWDGVFNLTAK